MKPYANEYTRRYTKGRTALLPAFVIMATVPLLTGCPEQRSGMRRSLPPPLVHAPGITPSKPLRPKVQPRTPSSVSLHGTIIVIDPGHGGKYPGAWADRRVLSKLPEKTIVLDIAKKVERLLTERGANVIMTRTTDRTVELEDRAKIAENSKADLFVSIHADSAPRSGASGAEVYHYERASAQSIIAARCMMAAFKKCGIHHRSIHPKDLHVLREHSRPAILVECGFLTDRSDAQKLNTDSYRTKMAEVIAVGITDYFAQ